VALPLGVNCLPHQIIPFPTHTPLPQVHLEQGWFSVHCCDQSNKNSSLYFLQAQKPTKKKLQCILCSKKKKLWGGIQAGVVFITVTLI
jgi:hypothetical protein